MAPRVTQSQHMDSFGGVISPKILKFPVSLQEGTSPTLVHKAE